MQCVEFPLGADPKELSASVRSNLRARLTQCTSLKAFMVAASPWNSADQSKPPVGYAGFAGNRFNLNLGSHPVEHQAPHQRLPENAPGSKSNAWGFQVAIIPNTPACPRRRAAVQKF